MRYEEFKELFVGKLKEALGEEITIKTSVFEKNNGRNREGIIVSINDTLHPVIYLEALYEEYEEGGMIEEMLGRILSIIKSDSNVKKENVQILLDGEWDKIKDNIEVCVINKEWNRERLKTIPYIEYLDLALVFRVVLDNECSMCCLMNNNILATWGIEKDELVDAALSKLNSTSFNIKSLTEVFRECMRDAEQEEMYDDFVETNDIDIPIYVLSNDKKTQGAAAIARIDIISKFANEIENDLYILPSSIHELLLLPAKEDCSVKELKEMVICVNESEVDREEWLSDNVYLFSRERMFRDCVVIVRIPYFVG